VGFWQPAKPVFARLLPFIASDNEIRYVVLFLTQGYFNPQWTHSPRAQLQSTLDTHSDWCVNMKDTTRLHFHPNGTEKHGLALSPFCVLALPPPAARANGSVPQEVTAVTYQSCRRSAKWPTEKSSWLTWCVGTIRAMEVSV
jgi:hypothetical protein